MNKREKRERLANIVAALKEVYPDAACALEYEGDPWRLLVMGRLSAQCTDARVNIVCRELFRAFPNAQAMTAGELAEIEHIVRPCGLYRIKAANLKDASQMILDEFDGEVPREMEDLLRLPGVSRKIANLIRGDIYHLPAVVTDTHCIRICGRLGMYPESQKDPGKIEVILTDLIDGREASDFCHRIVMFGREWCMARSPRCHECPLAMRGLCEKHNREVKKNG